MGDESGCHWCPDPVIPSEGFCFSFPCPSSHGNVVATPVNMDLPAHLQGMADAGDVHKKTPYWIVRNSCTSQRLPEPQLNRRSSFTHQLILSVAPPLVRLWAGGEDWGMQGYVFMSRGKSNQCGVASDAIYAIV